MKKETMDILELYKNKYQFISEIEEQILGAYMILNKSYNDGGKLLVCGNGGSNSDADHIVGELIKGFNKLRPLTGDLKAKIESQGEEGRLLVDNLQGSLPAINLGAHTSLITAVINDIGGEEIYAQQVMGYGTSSDVLLGITTSGNSKNIVKAMIVAKAKGMKIIGLTGSNRGKIADWCDIMIQVPSKCTPDIQDMHTPVYHVLCSMLEMERWSK